MKRALAVLAFSSLAACAWTTNQTDITGQQLSYRTGTGVVEAINPAPKPFTVAAGGTAPTSPYEPSLNRLTVRMDDGRRQYIDTESTEFTRGTRVRLTDERLIEKQ
ncbi:MAG TPA: hypothetical protein VM140_05140 [Burkholderiales bacterium]|nr:hypothetical protein [Burkholderiales bacterium]